MTKPKLNLGKRIGTYQGGNDFWIKKYENGVKIRKKGQEELTLDIVEIFEMLLCLRKYPIKFGNPILLNSLDLSFVWQKYPDTKEFVERLLMDKVSNKEKLKIQKNYMTKLEILRKLEDESKE